MKTLCAYLRERAAVLLAVPVVAGVGWLLFYLYGLPFAALGYILAVVGVVWLVLFVVPGYVRYARRVRRLEELRANLDALTGPVGLAATLPEAILLDSLESLRGRMQEADGEHLRQQADMMAYYTLWVHQVKTPIAAMRLILQSQPQADGGALGQELFKIERYVEMVLGYLRLETISEDLRLEECDVRRVAARAAKKFAPQFIYKKISFDLEDFHMRAVTDEKWLLFVLEQVLSNAVKYTQKGGVRIALDGEVLRVCDTGAGIAPEDLPRIFQRGFTGRNGRAEAASTGLGLYLVKRAADTLRMPVEVRSVLGEGTEVRLDLHRDAAPRD